LSISQGPVFYTFGDYRLDSRRRLLFRTDGEPIPLTPKAFDVLLYLLQHPGVAVSKEELLSAVWPDTAIEEGNLSQNIYTLRRALGEERGEHRYIATIPGSGYRFVATVATDVPAELLPRRPARAIAGIAAGLTVVVAIASVALLNRDSGDAIDQLAVLPFKPLVAGQRDESLELGMTEAVIARLSSIEGLRVAPLGVVRPYSSPTDDPVDVGRKLRVEAVLESHLQRDGDRIRVTARLLDVNHGKQLWSNRYEERFVDIFSLQDAIAMRVVDELAPELRGRTLKKAHHTSNPGAYEMYLKGRFFVSIAQPRRAIDMFEEAIRLDPGYALAYAGLADILSRLPIAAEVPSERALPRAREAVRTALRLDSTLGEAAAAEGWIEFYGLGDWERSERGFRRALQRNPTDFSATLGLGHLLSCMKRHDEALQRIENAVRIDPHSPIAATLKGQFLFHAGRIEDSLTQLRSAHEAHPLFWIAQIHLARALSASGHHDEALQILNKARDSDPTTTSLATIAVVSGEAGRHGDAEAIARQLEMLREKRPVSSYNIALAHRAAGNSRSAEEWLTRARGENDVRLVFASVEPLWQHTPASGQ
ncbi:MAG TPA: tetratricopeptide repeat protein, partial [Thermoanaerobaculia bacterium]|nr:tetratricopeptide repeat protein [Thermoanaerobaculia bacterium]